MQPNEKEIFSKMYVEYDPILAKQYKKQKFTYRGRNENRS